MKSAVTSDQTVQMLYGQGMRLFYPPNVGGWPNGPAWISPSNQVLRFNLAAGVVTKSGNLSGKADDAWIGELTDRLGRIPLSHDVPGELTALGGAHEAARGVAQVILR